MLNSENLGGEIDGVPRIHNGYGEVHKCELFWLRPLTLEIVNKFNVPKFHVSVMNGAASISARRVSYFNVARRFVVAGHSLNTHVRNQYCDHYGPGVNHALVGRVRMTTQFKHRRTPIQLW